MKRNFTPDLLDPVSQEFRDLSNSIETTLLPALKNNEPAIEAISGKRIYIVCFQHLCLAAKSKSVSLSSVWRGKPILF